MAELIQYWLNTKKTSKKYTSSSSGKSMLLNISGANHKKQHDKKNCEKKKGKCERDLVLSFPSPVRNKLYQQAEVQTLLQ